MRIKYAVMMSLFFCSAGCARLSPDRCAVSDSMRAEAAQIRQSFAEQLPDDFTLVSAVIFKYHFAAFSALGFTRVNEPRGEYELAAMNPAGIKLLELKRNKDGSVTQLFVMPEIAARGDVCRAVGADIERIYFSRLPPEKSRISRRGRYLIFSVPSEEGVTEYFFGSEKEKRVLLFKRFFVGRKNVWEISYSGYCRDKKDKLHPQNIVFTHRQYSYRIFLRVKEIRL